MDAFRITWTLAGAMRRPDHPILLDALLAWAVVDEAREQGHPDPVSEQENLPLARFETQDGWCFKASSVAFRVLAGAYPMMMTRPTRVAEYAEARAKRHFIGGADRITLGTGRHKAYFFSQPMQQVDKAVAFGVGDVDRVRELLERIKSLGKLRRMNAGAIRGFDVEAGEAFSDRWRHRVLPSEEPGYARIFSALRPPYWKRESGVEAYAPITAMQGLDEGVWA